MRTHFDKVLGKTEDASREKMGMSVEEFMYMSIWYALLFVVIEGWNKLKLSDEKISELLLSPNVDLLRRYRNGVFHFQKKYIDERFLGFISDGKDCVTWVRDLNNEFGRFFLNYFKQK